MFCLKVVLEGEFNLFFFPEALQIRRSDKYLHSQMPWNPYSEKKGKTEQDFEFSGW